MGGFFSRVSSWIEPDEIKKAVLMALKEKLEKDKERESRKLKSRSKAFVKRLR